MDGSSRSHSIRVDDVSRSVGGKGCLRVAHGITCDPRSENDTEAWWATGDPNAFFFYYVYKPGGANHGPGPHSRVCLAKVAGNLGAMQGRCTAALHCASTFTF